MTKKMSIVFFKNIIIFTVGVNLDRGLWILWRVLMPSHQLISHPLAPVLVRRPQGNFISHTLHPRGEGTRVDPAWECLSPFLGGCYIQP